MRKVLLLVIFVSFCLTIVIGNAVAGPLADAGQQIEKIGGEVWHKAGDVYKKAPSLDELRSKAGKVGKTVKGKVHDWTK